MISADPCIVYRAEEAIQATQKIGSPVVVKPLDANHGRGVSINLTQDADVKAGFASSGTTFKQFCHSDRELCRRLRSPHSASFKRRLQFPV